MRPGIGVQRDCIGLVPSVAAGAGDPRWQQAGTERAQADRDSSPVLTATSARCAELSVNVGGGSCLDELGRSARSRQASIAAIRTHELDDQCQPLPNRPVEWISVW